MLKAWHFATLSLWTRTASYVLLSGTSTTTPSCQTPMTGQVWTSTPRLTRSITDPQCSIPNLFFVWNFTLYTDLLKWSVFLVQMCLCLKKAIDCFYVTAFALKQSSKICEKVEWKVILEREGNLNETSCSLLTSQLFFTSVTCTAPAGHLLVDKSSAEISFY